MTAEWAPVLKDVISEVLETMFFAMVDFEDGDSVEKLFDYESEIQLLNHKGRHAISLRVSAGFARMITANFLGIEEEQVKEEDLEDSLRELANMVGGSYHAQTNNIDWRLGIPRAWRIESVEPDPCEPAAGICFGCFGEPAGSARISYLPNGA